MNEFTAITATIPTSTVDILAEKIANVNKKGGNFRYRVVETTTIERHFDYDGIPKVAKVHASVVEVIGQQITVDGSSWSFIAHIDHSSSPAMVTTATNDKRQIVALHRNLAQKCDHCQQNRIRRYTYIAENVDTGKRVQVGSTCLQAYFGNMTAANLIQMATWLRTIPQWFNDDEFKGSSRRPYFDTETVLKGAAQSILNRGYHKTTGIDTPTCVEAPYITQFSDEAVKLATEAMAWIKSLGTQKDFELNMQAAVSAEWIDYRRHGGVLCYVVEAYRKHVAKQIIDKKSTASRTEDCPNDASRHTVSGTVISIKEVTDYYGLQVKLLMETTGGYRLYGTCPRPLYDAEVGDSVQFDCKIKNKDAGYGYINRPTKAKVLETA